MWFSCLPWYDLAELRDATDSLWQRVAGHLEALGIEGAPQELDRSIPYEQQWKSSQLLLGQACGYDVLISYRDDLQIVAAPRYEVPGCKGACYRSHVVVREDHHAMALAELRGARCVINTPTSHSGMNILRSLVAPLAESGEFFSDVTVSGAHERSMAMVRGGEADVAAIDCVTYGLLAKHRPSALAGTRILYRTQLVPAPPYVTSASTPEPIVAALREALHLALPDPELHILGIDDSDLADYQPIGALARTAQCCEYRELPP